MKNLFTDANRIQKTEDYRRLLRQGERLKAKSMTIFYQPNHLSVSRLGIIIAKKQIPKAVARNHYKRLIKESFRQSEIVRAKQHDVVVMLFKNVIEMDDTTFMSQLETLWKKLPA